MLLKQFKQYRFLSLTLILVILAASLGSQFGQVTASMLETSASMGSPSTATGTALSPPMYLPLIANNSFTHGPSIFGTDFGNIKVSNGLRVMRQAGSYWTRRGQVLWSQVEPAPGVRNWDALGTLPDELITSQEFGFPTILVIQSAPDWARTIPGMSCSRILTDTIPAFASFMHDIVARFSVAPYNVKYWEVWNEPDVDPSIVSTPDSGYGCWGDLNDPFYGGAYYADVLQAVYPQVKAADPDAQLIIGGLLLSCNPNDPNACTSGTHGNLPPKYLEGILSHRGVNDGGLYFNGIDFHAYDRYEINKGLGHYTNDDWGTFETDGPVIGLKADFINSVLAAYNVHGKFLINSEAALTCGWDIDPPGSPGCEKTDTSAYELTKMYYLAQTYTVGQAKGLKGVLWYEIWGWRNSGLLYPDYTYRPAGFAYAAAYTALHDAVFLEKITQFPRVEGYKFDKGGGRILWVLWSNDAGISYPVTLDRTPSAVIDALGVSLPLTTSIDVSQKPVYIEWLP